MPYVNCNNANLYYIDEGSGNETIFFSHGLLMSSEMFRAQIDHFKSRYRCIAFDHRGQGLSEVTETGYNIWFKGVTKIQVTLRDACTSWY